MNGLDHILLIATLYLGISQQHGLFWSDRNCGAGETRSSDRHFGSWRSETDLNSQIFSEYGLKKFTLDEESFMTGQSGQTCTSPMTPNKRPVFNTTRGDGELCLTLSVGKASVMIFIEETASSNIRVLQLPRMHAKHK